MNDPQPRTRRDFIKDTIAGGATATALCATGVLALADGNGGIIQGRKVKVAVIGCGDVSGSYFPTLAASPNVELVST